MRADLILGFDPVPGDAQTAHALSQALHTTVRALVEARTDLDAVIAAGPVFEGRSGAPIADILRRIALRISAVEEAVVECRKAADDWRTGLEQRQSEVAEIVRAVSDLAGRTEAAERRGQLLAHAREIAGQHDRAGNELAAAFEVLVAATTQAVAGQATLASDLGSALAALDSAVEEWIESEGPELIRTAIALGEVATLTTVISELIGIAALGRVPGDAAGVREAIARSPGSHRLVRALRQQWIERAPDSLPEASFATRSRTLASIVAGGPDALPDGASGSGG